MPDLAATADAPTSAPDAAPPLERLTVEGLEVLRRVPAATGRPPILFVHGATLGAWCWDVHWMPEAARRGWPCWAVSVRGHERQEGPPKTATLGHYVDDVLQVIVRMPEAPVLVGHSMGGLVVQRVVSRYPARAAVLLCTTRWRGGAGVQASIARHHPLDLVHGVAGGSIPTRTAYHFGPEAGPDEEALLARCVPESPLAQYQIGLPLPEPGTARCPVLVVGAGEDGLVPAVDSVRLARRHGTLAHVLRGMGHDLMLEPRWRQPLDLVLEWLDAEVPPAGSSAAAG